MSKAKRELKLQSKLNSDLFQIIDMNSSPSIDPLSAVADKKSGKWTADEDDLLHKIISEHGAKNWRKIADFIPGRSSIQCLHRWTKILKPGLVKGPWSKEEDYLL